MKTIFIAIASFIAGGAICGLAATWFLGGMMGHGVYLRTASETNIHLQTIKHIDNNDIEKAITMHEHFLKSSKFLLENCEPKFCADNKFPEVNKALKNIESYEFKYITNDL